MDSGDLESVVIEPTPESPMTVTQTVIAELKNSEEMEDTRNSQISEEHPQETPKTQILEETTETQILEEQPPSVVAHAGETADFAKGVKKTERNLDAEASISIEGEGSTDAVAEVETREEPNHIPNTVKTGIELQDTNKEEDTGGKEEENAVIPEEGKLEEGKPEEGKSEPGKPVAGKPEGQDERDSALEIAPLAVEYPPETPCFAKDFLEAAASFEKMRASGKGKASPASMAKKKLVYPATEPRRSPRNKQPPPPPPRRLKKKGTKQRKGSKDGDIHVKHSPGFARFIECKMNETSCTGKNLYPKNELTMYKQWIGLPASKRNQYEQDALYPSSSSEDEGASQYTVQQRSSGRSVQVEDDEDDEDEDYVEEEEVEDYDDESVEEEEEYANGEEEEQEKEEENDGESDPESHHGNAVNAYVRYKNVTLYQLKKLNSDKRMTKTFLAQIHDEWIKLSLADKKVYLFGAQAERQKRKKEGTMKRRTNAEIKKDKLKKVQKKEVKKLRPKGHKYSRRWQSFMSLPSMVAIFKGMTAAQTDWLSEVGLGGLIHLKIEKTPEAFNKFIYSCYDVEGYLNAHGRSVEMTEETVKWLVGISCTGERTFPKHDPGVVQRIQDELGLVDSYTPIKDFLPWFHKEENKELLNDEWKRRVVIFILACIGLPVTRQGVRRTLAEFVVDLEYLKNVNWAAIWLKHFRDQQKLVKQGYSVRGAGCVLIPMLLYMEKFCPKLEDLPAGCENLQITPRLKLWETKDIIRRWNFVRDDLKHLKLRRNEEQPAAPIIAPPVEVVKEVVGMVLNDISERFFESFMNRKAEEKKKRKEEKRKKAEMDEREEEENRKKAEEAEEEEKEKRKGKEEKKHMDGSEEEKASEKKRKRQKKGDNEEEKAREKKRKRKKKEDIEEVREQKEKNSEEGDETGREDTNQEAEKE